MPPRTKAPGNTLAPSSSSRPAAAPRPPRSNLKPEDISDLRTKALYLLYPNPVLRHLDIDPKTVSRARKLVQQILDEAATLDPEVGYPDDYLSEDADEFCDEYGSDDSYNDEYRREERGMERLEKRDKATELASLQAFAHHFLAELSPAAPPLAAVANADMSKRRRVDAVGGDGKSKELTRAEHFEEARWAVQRFTLNVSRTGSVWGPENQLAHAQYWLTVARCADELAPERVEPGYHGHATDWRAAFWKEPPGAAGQRLKGYCGPFDSFFAWTRTATYRLEQLSRAPDAEPSRRSPSSTPPTGALSRRSIGTRPRDPRRPGSSSCVSRRCSPMSGPTRRRCSRARSRPSTRRRRSCSTKTTCTPPSRLTNRVSVLASSRP